MPTGAGLAWAGASRLGRQEVIGRRRPRPLPAATRGRTKGKAWRIVTRTSLGIRVDVQDEGGQAQDVADKPVDEAGVGAEEGRRRRSRC